MPGSADSTVSLYGRNSKCYYRVWLLNEGLLIGRGYLLVEGMGRDRNKMLKVSKCFDMSLQNLVPKYMDKFNA